MDTSVPTALTTRDSGSKTVFEPSNGWLLNKLIWHRDDAEDYQSRKRPDWLENYQLYRGKVITNRFTQRQSTSIPLAKETVNTVLSRIDDPPSVVFKNRSNDRVVDTIINAYWEKFYKDNQLDILDLIDKKQNAIYGRSYYMLNVKKEGITVSVVDPYDIVIDRLADPSNIQSATYIARTHVYKPFKDIKKNKLYDKKVLQAMGIWAEDVQNALILEGNSTTRVDSNKRMSTLGDTNVNYPKYGENIYELTLNFLKMWDEKAGEYKIHYIVTAQNTFILCDVLLEDVIGINEFPITSWALDIESLDWYSDGIVDIVRPINKIMNVYMSQLVENRTLSNYGMNYYDATRKDFLPPILDPIPFGWYPLPGKPSDVVQRIDIRPLTDSLNEMQYLTGVIEKATSSTATLKGATGSGNITLGEVEIAQQNALERINSMSIYYRNNVKQLATLWSKLLFANADDMDNVTLWKKGNTLDKWYEKEVNLSSLKKDEGYDIEIMSSSEQDQQTMKSVQLITAIAQQVPSPILQREKNKKLVSMLKLDAQTEKSIIDELSKTEESQNLGEAPMPGQMPSQNPSSPGNQPNMEAKAIMSQLTPQPNEQPIK